MLWLTIREIDQETRVKWRSLWRRTITTMWPMDGHRRSKALETLRLREGTLFMAFQEESPGERSSLEPTFGWPMGVLVVEYPGTGAVTDACRAQSGQSEFARILKVATAKAGIGRHFVRTVVHRVWGKWECGVCVHGARYAVGFYEKLGMRRVTHPVPGFPRRSDSIYTTFYWTANDIAGQSPAGSGLPDG